MSSVFLSNVDDYLGPSQACVNPLFTTDKVNQTEETTTTTTSSNGNSPPLGTVKRRARVRRRVEPDQIPFISTTTTTTTSTETSSSVLQASIADCLACSGCVTTAETVLLQEQHSLQILRDEFMLRRTADETATTNSSSDRRSTTTNNNKKLLVVTISPASWADLLRHVLHPAGGGMTVAATGNKDNHSSSHHLLQKQQQLAMLLHETFGARVVLDGNVSLQWARHEAALEFCRAWRYQHHKPPTTDVTNGHGGDTEQQLSQEERLEQELTPSMALSSTQTQYALRSSSNDSSHSATPPTTTLTLVHNTATGISHRQQQALPLVASSCPAVVCLVEKSLHTAVPHLATTKSPMAVAGAFWKHNNTHFSSPSAVFHLAVMPCHDKKLEASRKDFWSNNEKDVDMVITTQECLQLLQEGLVLRRQQKQQESLEEADENSDAARWLRTGLAAQPLAPAYRGVHAWLSSPSLWKDPCVLVVPEQEMEGSNTLAMEAADATGTMPNNDTTSLSFNDAVFALGSGGYADYIFRFAARELFGVHLDPRTNLHWTPVTAIALGETTTTQKKRVSARVASLQQQRGRRDYYQVTLYRHDNGSYSMNPPADDSLSSKPILCFAIAYGMQTIQRVLQPFQPKENDDTTTRTSNNNRCSTKSNCQFDYIEAMACPSGCINGGGQIRLSERETPTETRQRVAATRGWFQTLPPVKIGSSHPELVSMVESSFQTILPLHTRFHVVPPLQLALGAAAGVAVADTQW